MVIHDMRNPTNSIDYALKEVIRIIKQKESRDKHTVRASPSYQAESMLNRQAVASPCNDSQQCRGSISSKAISRPQKLSNDSNLLMGNQSS